MILRIRQWESKYIRDFSVVKDGSISEEILYKKLTAMYFDYVSTNDIEPYTISFGRGKGFYITANSHVGVIVYGDVVLYIESMIPDLTLGKILYLHSQSEDVISDSITRQVLSEKLNDEESIAAADYFVVALLNAIEDIKQNGMICELDQLFDTTSRIVGKIDFSKQISKNPAYDKFHVERPVSSYDILPNRAIKAAVIKSKELSSLGWLASFLDEAAMFFGNVDEQSELDVQSFPKVSEYTSIKRPDYEKALRFSKYILFGYDPLSGEGESFFPEFMLDMNVVFEFYVTIGLKRIFKEGFDNKKVFSLGVGPIDIPIERKNIELDGFYSLGDKKVVIDTKNKYRSVLDRDIPDFIASNPDIYQQYYYASRVGASQIILVYPSSKKHTKPIGEYQLNFSGNRNIKLYFWALHITGTPRENKNALINLAQFIASL